MIISILGIIILAGYLTSDAFTSNWQSRLYKTYSMSPSQMMCCVNLFSVLLTSISLFGQGTFWASLSFAFDHAAFMNDIFMLSVCSAVGQSFIYLTVEQFGPVNFTIIMTMRQIVAIILSCIIYGHAVSLMGLFGILVVFSGVFMRIHLSRRSERKNRAVAEETPKV